MSSANLLDYLPSELEDVAEGLRAPRYRGRQLARWLFAKGAGSLAEMTDLPRDFRQALAAEMRVTLPEPERVTPSRDGSRKIVFRLGDDARVQSVLIPDEDRLTLCLSTQVGCGFGCAFCFTGTMGAERDLSSGEIVGQYLAARRILDPGARITHVVYMGMGEPLANYQATVRSLRVLIDPRGAGVSPRRVTVSTVGLVPAIERFGREGLRVNLAISLHAATDEVRGRIMPVNRPFPMDTLLAACRRFPLPARQRMTFEYVLLEGVNDSPEEARRLVKRLHGLRAKVNLIPFNDWPGSEFGRPPLPRILAFQAILLEHGITATIRWSKGEDVGAACGQLSDTAARAVS
jgi:23S rRNA (adenine2503-C2)-methyltransferase